MLFFILYEVLNKSATVSQSVKGRTFCKKEVSRLSRNWVSKFRLVSVQMSLVLVFGAEESCKALSISCLSVSSINSSLSLSSSSSLHKQNLPPGKPHSSLIFSNILHRVGYSFRHWIEVMDGTTNHFSVKGIRVDFDSGYTISFDWCQAGHHDLHTSGVSDWWFLMINQ